MPKLIIYRNILVRLLSLSLLLAPSACFKNKMALPEIELGKKAKQMKEGSNSEELCEFISSVINHQRHTLGRRHVSAPPIVSFYAIDCLKRGMLKEKYFIFNVPITEENLLYRSALCGEINAIDVVRRYHEENFKPRFSQRLVNHEYYLEDTKMFAPPSDDRFPYVSIDGEIFCGYAALEFSLTDTVFTPLVALPVAFVGVSVYLLSFGSINIFDLL